MQPFSWLLRTCEQVSCFLTYIYSFQWSLLASVVTRLVMASRIVKSPAVQSTARRQYGQAAVARTDREFVKSEPLKVSTLPNGLTVASIENHSPVTTLGVAIKVRLYN